MMWVIQHSRSHVPASCVPRCPCQGDVRVEFEALKFEQR